jgi:hypothetical protein
MENHWGLVQIDWANGSVNFYDSMPRRQSAAKQEEVVRASVDVLMAVMRHIEMIKNTQRFDWVSERVSKNDT